MRQILRDITLLLIVLIIIVWPAGLHKSIIETLGQIKVMPQTTPDPKELRDKTIIALQLSYTNLNKIIKIGYETHPEEFVTASNYFNDALSYFPSFTNDHPYTIPYLKIIHITDSTRYWKFYKFVVSDLFQDMGHELLVEFLPLFPQFQVGCSISPLC